MQVSTSLFRGIQIVVVLCVLVIVGVVSYLVFTTTADQDALDLKRKAEITRMQSTAHAYFARLEYYDGTCEAIGADEIHRCSESDSGYAVEARLTDGTYYCADSTAFRGRILYSKGDRITCQ